MSSGAISDHEPVVFGAALDGLRKALDKQLTPELRKELLGIGVDFERLQVAYSLDTWLQVVRMVAGTVSANLPEGLRYRHLGRVFMRGFVQTTIGFAALTAGKLFGVKRTMLRMGRNFKTAANYIETTSEEVGPKELKIRTFIQPEFLPKVKDRSMLILEYRQGVLEEVLAQVGGVGTVEIIDPHPEVHDATFHIRWQ